MGATEERLTGMTDLLSHDRARRVRRHSMLVRHLRLIVPALASGLAMTYAFSATPPQIDRDFANQFKALADNDDGGARLASPRYSGEDLSGQPFEVAAVTATRHNENPDAVDLENPQATRVTERGKRVTVTAIDGRFNQDQQVMDLANNVEMQEAGADGDTFVLRTDAATMNLEQQVVTANAEVTGVGDGIMLRADRGQVYQNEDRQVLEGRVKIRIAPKKVDERSKADKSKRPTDSY